jgi:hypothetical protein
LYRLIATTLGVPVEPDVKITRAGLILIRRSARIEGDGIQIHKRRLQHRRRADNLEGVYLGGRLLLNVVCQLLVFGSYDNGCADTVLAL